MEGFYNNYKGVHKELCLIIENLRLIWFLTPPGNPNALISISLPYKIIPLTLTYFYCRRQDGDSALFRSFMDKKIKGQQV